MKRTGPSTYYYLTPDHIPTFVILETSAYGDRGWWWYYDNMRSDRPYMTKRAAALSLENHIKLQRV